MFIVQKSPRKSACQLGQVINGQDDIVWTQRLADGGSRAVRTSSRHLTGSLPLLCSMVIVGRRWWNDYNSQLEFMIRHIIYSQRDPRWAGCYIMENNWLFAAFCIISNDYFWYYRSNVFTNNRSSSFIIHTDTFVKIVHLESSKNLLSKRGRTGTDVLHSSAALKALAAGHHVMAAVGSSVFASFILLPIEIVLSTWPSRSWSHL